MGKADDDSFVVEKQEIKPGYNLKKFKHLYKLTMKECTMKDLTFVKETVTLLNLSGSKVENYSALGKLSKLRVLNLTGCGLTAVPPSVFELKGLNALVLSHNAIEAIPEEIENLTELNTIVVSNNKLTSLPDCLRKLTKLKKLSASHNKLKTLPDLSDNKELKEIRLNDNEMVSLPEHFGTWGDGHLITLEIANCRFEEWAALKPLSLQNYIVNFGIKGNPVVADTDDLYATLKILLPRLRTLDGQRQDEKHADLKQKRASRTVEQKIVDSGPMGLAQNAASKKPLKIPAELIKGKRRLIVEEIKASKKRKASEKNEKEKKKQKKEEAESKEIIAADKELKDKPSKEKKSSKDDKKSKDKKSKDKKSKEESSKTKTKTKKVKKSEGSTDEASQGHTLDILKGEENAEKPKKEKESHKEHKTKEKSSVSKIIEIKKKKDDNAESIASLLDKATEPEIESGWD